MSDSELFDGVLFQTECTPSLRALIQKKTATSGLRCVLFDASFAGDFENLQKRDFQLEINSQVSDGARSVFLVVEKMKRLCEDLIERFAVDVVLSQKVVHPSVKRYLAERNVICIDRLSIHLTKFLGDLTGCQVCSSAWNLNQFGSSTFGRLASISVKSVKGKHYIHFENQTVDGGIACPVQTMVVCVQNETFSAEIQVCVLQWLESSVVLIG